MIRIGTVFSGIGAPEEALRQLDIKHRIIFACDSDRFSKRAYLANYQPTDWHDCITNIDAYKYKNEVDILNFKGIVC